MPADLPAAVEINPRTPPRACLLWLHGLGADGHDFEPLIPQLGIVEELGVRVVLPHAPQRPVTINNGMVMRAWYDIRTGDFRNGEDDPGIRDSERLLQGLIAREQDSGIPAARIVLAGFSQGGAIALHTGLRYPQRLGGLLVLSAYLPLAATVAAERSIANVDVPVLQAHGTQDPVVPFPWAERSRDYLRELGYAVEWREYPMPHAVCPDEVAEIRDWLIRVFGEGRG